MAVRKIKTSWWVDFQIHFRRYRFRSPENTRQGALAHEALLRQKLLKDGSLEPLLSVEDNFKDFSENWLQIYVANNNKPSEQESKTCTVRNLLIPFFGHMKLKDITNQTIEAFKAAELARGLKAKTINNYLGILRKCLNTAVDWGKLDTCPKFKPLKTEMPKFKYLTEEQAEKLINAAPRGLWQTMVIVALRTGMRCSELIGLEWEDVDLVNRLICVRRTNVRGHVGCPKSYRTRYVPLTDDAAQVLIALPRSHKLVFAHNGDWMRYEVGRLHLAKFCREANIEVVGWHALRHTFASQLVASGVPLNAVQQLLGHSTINMTMRYSHVNQNDLRKAISVLEKHTVQNPASIWRQPEALSLEKILSKINL